jgi:hypothetical protein
LPDRRAARAFSSTHCQFSIALQVQDSLQDAAYETEGSVRLNSVSAAAVKTVLVTATESFAEVVLVLGQVNIVAIVAVRCILVGVRVTIVETPPVLSIRDTGAHTLLVTEVQSTTQQVGAILVRLVVSPAAVVAIAVRRE